jgi:hypothetical protein
LGGLALVLTVGFGAVFVAIIGALMFVINRWLSAWAAVFVGAATFAYIAHNMVTGIIYCAAEPVYIPPSEVEAAAGSEGSMRFNCDSAGGVIEYLYLYFIAPLILVALGVLILKYYGKVRSA